jgi:hypothetical protein
LGGGTVAPVPPRGKLAAAVAADAEVASIWERPVYFNKIDQWELFDLRQDPYEVKNVYADPGYAQKVRTLKAEMYRLKKELKDENQFEKELPRDDVDTGTGPRSNYPPGK